MNFRGTPTDAAWTRQFVAKELPPDESVSLSVGGGATLGAPARHARVSIRIPDVSWPISNVSIEIPDSTSRCRNRTFFGRRLTGGHAHI